jgi:nicotinate phosphoribosyltransferase
MTRKLSDKALLKKGIDPFKTRPKRKKIITKAIKKFTRRNPDKHIIEHLTQTDAYKYSMGQFYKHRCYNDTAKWEFCLRTKGVDLTYLIEDICAELDWLCTLRYTKEEIEGIRKKLPWLSDDFIRYLEKLQLDRKYIRVFADPSVNGGVRIVAEGPQLDVFWFEIYVLQIVQQLYFEGEEFDWEYAKKNLEEVVVKWNKAWREGCRFTVSDFGVRRGISNEWNEYMVMYLLKFCPAFVGTSNVWLAIKCDCKAIGTFAHELYAIAQAKGIRLKDAQKWVLSNWDDEFRGSLGIALSDNFGFAAFLRDFDVSFMKLYDGCRHDSGDPFKWGHMLIDHYRRGKVDPKSKTACWSDSLDADKALKIAWEFYKDINVAFGIGTFLSATICCKPGAKQPLSIVMKVTECNGQHVVKLSDSEGKCMCTDQKTIIDTKLAYNWAPIDRFSRKQLDEIIYGGRLVKFDPKGNIIDEFEVAA